MRHVVLYVPGLGDTDVAARRLMIAGWRLYGVLPVIHQMNWADGKPFDSKLDSLLARIDGLVADGHTVSLVGESAGASAAIIAYESRQNDIHRVACICGKLRGTVSASRTSPFGESMSRLPTSLQRLSTEKRGRIRSVRPLSDPVVPVADTHIPGADMLTIPTHGHAQSIVLGCTVFSWQLLRFLKRP